MIYNSKWLIDQYILKDYNKSDIESVFKKYHIQYEILSYRPFVDDITSQFNKTENIIVYGSCSFVQKTKSYFGNYCNEKNLLFSSYISNLNVPNDYFLNNDFVIVPFKRFKHATIEFFKMFNSKSLFIRPNSGMKVFTGFVINLDNYLYEFNSMKFLTGVCDDTLIVVSSEKSIINEYRFIICGDKVIDGSMYNCGGELIKSRAHLPREAYTLAESVAKSIWTPDPIFTCDVAKTPNGFKIIELNSFSCAGWYACDPELIITEVSKFNDNLYNETYN